MSALGLLNRVVFQWTCFRLAKVVDVEGRRVGWKWLGPVLPLTGWGSDYVWIGRRRA